MPKCLECGFESVRLQWTHFRYKCTGRFKNGTEYMQAYPDATVVDPEISKKTSITLDNMISKYGETDGRSRWEHYREKQAYTNSLEYKRDNHGWTEEEYKEYNRSRSVTVDNMVAKHGLEEGLRRWDDYCEKQRITKSREYVIEKHGQEFWYDLCKKKAHTVENTAVRYSLTYDDAAKKLAARYRLSYCSKLETEFINALTDSLGPLEHTSLHKPYGRWNRQGNGYVVYDIKHGDCIIEFNGDYWHANPAIYESTDLIRNVPARDIWEKDRQKREIAEQVGLRFLVVWEKDYLEDKQKVIKETVEWMLNTRD
jgi:hypothetical protein